MTTKRLSNIIIITTIAFPVLCWLCCQSLTYDLDGIEKPFFLWLKEGAVQKFVSTKNDTTIFTITKIEKRKKKPDMNIPIIGGGDLFHSRTNFYGYCNITGDTQSIKPKNGIYIYIEKLNKSDIMADIYFGNDDHYNTLVVFPNRVFKLNSSGNIDLNFSNTVIVEKRVFKDSEFFKQKEGNARGSIISYIWSKRYGLLQYTTADSLVWTRINIEEPTEK